MRRFLEVLGALNILFWSVTTFRWFFGLRRMTVLKDVGEEYGHGGRSPKLSVIVPARDEAKSVGRSIRSMLNQDYPNLEIVAVDDRSTDGTGEALADLAACHANLEALTVEELPPGWLGKTHALHTGAARSSGEWLLFTDADVRFDPACFRYALGYARAKGLDHMTLVPELVADGVPLKSFVASFELTFSLSQSPWEAINPDHEAHVGVGAFNLVRREAYTAAGGHEAIALRPDDDMKLAKLLKNSGFRQEAVFGKGLENVEWHESVGEAIRGLEKSAFPGLDYRLDKVILGSSLLVMTNVLPFAGLLLARGPARHLFAAATLAIGAAYAGHSRFVDTPLRYAPLHPLGASLLVYATAHSARKALATGGIEWRGTTYPL